MRRFLSAIAFLALLVSVLGAAGCGQRFDREPGDAPTAADLAAEALAALEAKGSAHFVAELRTGASSGGFPLEFAVHVEGDASASALDAEGSVSFGAGTFRGRVLVGEHDLFLQFNDQWYGLDQGLAEAMTEAKQDHDGKIWEELGTPAGLRRNFGELFTGEVGEGPEIDGVATWQFDGKLDADGVADFARRYGAELTDRDEQMLAKVADASRFLLVAGRNDRLPRRVELSVRLSAEELKEMEEDDSGPFGGAENFRTTLELSEFGKHVEIVPPGDFKPLDALFEELFSGFE